MCDVLSRINILVVDDDHACAESLSELISEQSVYKTYIATNCETALDLFCPNKYTIAFVDLNIDGSVENGVNLIKQIRLKDDNVFIVVVSAYSELIYNKTIIECADDFIRKPIDIDFFLSKLFLWCTKYERRVKVHAVNGKIEERINKYEAKLEAIKNIDYQIDKLSERIEASLPGEENWFRKHVHA